MSKSERFEGRRWRSARREEPGADSNQSTERAQDERAEDVAAREVPAKDSRKFDENWIAEVSHELRLPIANLKLLIETLLDGAVDDREAAERMLNRAQHEVNRLQHLVVNLLSVEKLSGSRFDLIRQRNLLAPKAAYALETVSRLANEKNIIITNEIPDDFYVHANPEQLDQVLLNLLENAVKFTPAGGKVTVRAGSKSGVFCVQDSGIGIAQSEIPRIFRRFYRVDRAHSKGSTGLGLSIVKHIADLHGAKITVTSKEGEGSVFQLDFSDGDDGSSKK